jgi:methionine sulfoxide reductase heme-binding subunit
MKYRGLDPRTRVLRWGLFLLAVVGVLYVTGGPALDTLRSWLTQEHDRLPWYATRLLALLSYLAISGSVIYGLLLSTGILDAIAHRAVSFTLHQDLAAIGLGLAMVHAAVLMIDTSVPYTPAEVLIPFAGPYRPLWVGAGQLSLYLTIVVTGSFYVRKRIGQKRWRTLHYVTFLAFMGATAHGLMAGTDTGAPWAFWGYLLLTATVVFLTAYRIVLAIAGRVAPATRMPTARGARPVTAPSAPDRADVAA